MVHVHTAASRREQRQQPKAARPAIFPDLGCALHEQPSTAFQLMRNQTARTADPSDRRLFNIVARLCHNDNAYVHPCGYCVHASACCVKTSGGCAHACGGCVRGAVTPQCGLARRRGTRDVWLKQLLTPPPNWQRHADRALRLVIGRVQSVKEDEERSRSEYESGNGGFPTGRERGRWSDP